MRQGDISIGLAGATAISIGHGYIRYESDAARRTTALETRSLLDSHIGEHVDLVNAHRHLSSLVIVVSILVDVHIDTAIARSLL